MSSSWQQIDAAGCLAAALELSEQERTWLDAVLEVAPTHVIDAHTHIARDQGIDDLDEELLGQVVTTSPVYTLEMAARARAVLWPGQGRALRAHGARRRRLSASTQSTATCRPSCRATTS